MTAIPPGLRLLLRPLADGDEALYRELFGDADVMREVAAPQSGDAAARGFLQALAMGREQPFRRRFWVIQNRAAGTALGLIGLTVDAPGAAEVGVVLPAAGQGRGVATEAIALLADHAFGPLGLRELHTRHNAGHQLAAGLMRSLDFENTARDPGAGGWTWRLTSERWATSTRRQATADPLT